MRDEIKVLVYYLSKIYNFPEPIVEIGSKASEDQEGYSDLRPYFKDKKYIGCDKVDDHGVDKIENAEDLTFKKMSIGTIICVDTLEHIVNPIKAMQEFRRVIKIGGVVLIVTHHWSPVHQKPVDYWRFTVHCMKDVIFGDFPFKEIFYHGDIAHPPLVGGIASNTQLEFKIDYKELNKLLPFQYPYLFVKFEG